MQPTTVRIFKAESRPYKNKETGATEYFNTVAVLYENELVDMQASKALVDYIQSNKDKLHNVEVPVKIKPRGYVLESVPGFTDPL